MNYEAEVKARWGETDAYQEYVTKERQPSNDTQMNKILAEFSECKARGHASDSPRVQSLVTRLQEHITKYYYRCTDEILSGLGQMYVCDPRFLKNIDRHGNGTAAFICEAIEFYCKK